ncbi:MAG: radical SAM family heme chaperone HemW [Propionibacteriaceae bacterium]|nr:radical SAM family heme chaperone HemW [Propionibacteriaceae bacterium]
MLSAYVHVPFCARRCGYCDFNTYAVGRIALSLDGWLDAILTEIAVRARPGGGPLSTVFIGGGTPTLLGAARLGSVLDALRGAFGLTPTAEVTVEANPETVTDDLLDALLDAGVNRLSLGMQSADEAVLATLDRAHTPGQALRSVEAAHRAGFGNVSLDLIYGTPGESLTSWATTLKAALSVCPEHVSCYALIVEPGTPLARRIARGDLPAPDDDLMADKYILADETLTAAGLRWYELSNWAQPNHACRHNLNYWRSGDWLGFGPGAHAAHGSVAGHPSRAHYWNQKQPTRWAAALARDHSGAAGAEALTAAEVHEERVLLELRLATGLPLDVLTPTEAARVPRLVADGLAITRRNRLSLTLKGRLLADKVTRDLLD